MKVNNIQGILKTYNQKKVKGIQKVSSIQGKRDEMQVSNEAQVLSKVLHTAKNAPEIRQEKVTELKQAIKQGTYNVSTEDVADKILKGIFFDQKG